jgi:hypothetical protein
MRNIRRYVRTAALAGLITAIAFSPLLLGPVWRPWLWPRVLQILVEFVSWSGFPAMMILSLFGVHGGPDGLPAFGPTAAVTFVLWWVALTAAPSLWRRFKSRRAGSGIARPDEFR